MSWLDDLFGAGNTDTYGNAVDTYDAAQVGDVGAPISDVAASVGDYTIPYDYMSADTSPMDWSQMGSWGQDVPQQSSGISLPQGVGGGGDPYGNAVDAYDAQTMSPVIAQEPKGYLSKLLSGDLNSKEVAQLKNILSLTGFGVSAFEKLAQNRSINQAVNARNAAAAQRAALSAPKPYTAQRTAMMPQGDMLRAGITGGPLQFFSPMTYTPKAEGGEIRHQPSLLNRLFGRAGHTDPQSTVGVIQRRPYQLYLKE